jgi:hypothetical protein
MPKFQVGDQVTISSEATIMRREAKGKQGVVKKVIGGVPTTPLVELAEGQDIPDPDQPLMFYEVVLYDPDITVEVAESDLIAEQQ